FFFSSRRRHTRFSRDWSSDVCSSDLLLAHLRGCVRQQPGLACGRVHAAPVRASGALGRSRGPLELESIPVRPAGLQGFGGTSERSEERRVGKEWRSRWSTEGETAETD